MSPARPRIAAVAGLAFVLAYIVVVVTLPDYTGRLWWPLEFVYWVVAGSIWVIPVRWLMMWSVGKL